MKQWNDLSDSLGISRTAMIHNAVKIYDLFIKNQLNGNNPENLKEQLEQIRLLLDGITSRENQLNKEKKEIDNTLSSINIDDINDFNIVASKILNLLENWGSLPSDTISLHLKYPGWIVWTVLKKLKEKKKVKLQNTEWCLYGDS